jgi:hypothetical protein
LEINFSHLTNPRWSHPRWTHLQVKYVLFSMYCHIAASLHRFGPFGSYLWTSFYLHTFSHCIITLTALGMGEQSQGCIACNLARISLKQLCCSSRLKSCEWC